MQVHREVQTLLMLQKSVNYYYQRIAKFVYGICIRNTCRNEFQMQSTVIQYTVEPVLKDHSIVHKNVVSQDRWSLETAYITWNVGPSARNICVFQDRWPLIATVSQDRFTVFTIRPLSFYRPHFL